MMTHDELSFLPDDYLERKMRRHTIWTGFPLISLVVMATAFLAFRDTLSLRAIERRHADIRKDDDQAIESFNRQCAQHDLQRKIIQHAAVASTLVETVPRSNIIAELTNCLPAGASLVDLTLDSHSKAEPASVATTTFDMKKAALLARQKAESIALPETSAMEVAVKLSGLADTDVQVAHYLSELNHSSLFHDVSLLISEAYPIPGKPERTLRRFQIQMTVNPDARLARWSDNTAPLTADLKE